MAGVPAVVIALTISPGKALLVGLIYLGLQLIVAYVLTPKILGKSSGLHPVSIIIALTAGAAWAESSEPSWPSRLCSW